MKTTVELPDHLLRRAKAAAATRGVSLKEFFTEAVERGLRAQARPTKPAWKELHGGLRSLRRETQKIRNVVEAEFEQVDAEDVD
jgi:hypothetical protein